MNIIHPTDFLIFSFDREVSQSKVLFQCPLMGDFYFLNTQKTLVALEWVLPPCHAF